MLVKESYRSRFRAQKTLRIRMPRFHTDEQTEAIDFATSDSKPDRILFYTSRTYKIAAATFSGKLTSIKMKRGGEVLEFRYTWLSYCLHGRKVDSSVSSV
jgi:hypothetical protein